MLGFLKGKSLSVKFLQKTAFSLVKSRLALGRDIPGRDITGRDITKRDMPRRDIHRRDIHMRDIQERYTQERYAQGKSLWTDEQQWVHLLTVQSVFCIANTGSSSFHFPSLPPRPPSLATGLPQFVLPCTKNCRKSI